MRERTLALAAHAITSGASMKATFRVYVLSSLAIALVLSLSVGGVALLWRWSRAAFGDYHVLVDLVVGLWLYGVFSGALLRVLLRVHPLAPGTYGIASRGFSYWMLLTVVHRLGKGALRPVVPFYLQPLIEALFGARVGRDVAVGGTIDDPYCVTLGAGVVLGNASLVTGNYISEGKLVCGTVTIGARATIGANCVVFPNTDIGADAVVAGGSFVMPGTRIPPGASWRGNPARPWIVKPPASAAEP
jgi:serine acetyltransferase